MSTIRCWAVTSGELADSTFVRWTSKFSSDADISEHLRLRSHRGLGLSRKKTNISLGVVEDAKYKRRDALNGLAAAAAKMVKEHTK